MLKQQEFVIYKITCLQNEKVYIGQSKNWRKRLNEHKRTLRNGSHRSKQLQRAWDKYGPNQFVHSIIEHCAESVLDEREIYWIEYYKATDKYKGFNNQLGGNTNKNVSEEARKNIAEAQRKNYYLKAYKYLNSPEAREKKRLAHLGSKRSESTKRKISEKAKLRTGEKNPFYGRIHTEETKSKISEAKTGISCPRNYKPLLATHLKTGEKLFFESRLEAEEHGFLRGGISEVLRGKKNHYKGYVFEDANSDTLVPR